MPLPKKATSGLLILVILLCPGFCLGKQIPSASAALPEASSGCDCCHAPPSDQSDPAPQSEGDPDCLCHGAILIVDKLEGYEAQLSLTPCALGMDATIVASAGRELSIGHSHARHFPPDRTGREICALICLLLI